MNLPKVYSAGTISVANGSTSVTGSGSSWLNIVSADDVLRKGGASVRIASVEGNGALTLAEAWPGTAVVDETYEIAVTFDGPEFQLRVRQVLEMLGQLQPLGLQPKAFGTFADREVYDDQAKGYIYLSLDGDGDESTAWTLFIKQSGDDADWDDGQAIEGPEGPNFDETISALGAGGGAREIDLTDSRVFSATVSTSAVTWTFSNVPGGGTVEASFTLYMTNGGSQTATWPTSVKWQDGVAPVLTVSGVDILVFTTIDEGTTWYGFVAGLAMG